MNIEQIEQKVIEIIQDKLPIDKAKVVPSASFIEDLGADSLDTVDIVMALEEGFEIDIPDEDSRKIAKVQDVVDYVSGKLA